ncbi:hypothetical protein ACERK3_18255 [Phycisphaerales bacterium AB-hyl4]|uniref:Uncharacterized protein n=1 Tax=Natronomicrosphaera hydrolytica TaxID=3242702 RepID=A0ABV4UAP8_9BACT
MLILLIAPIVNALVVLAMSWGLMLIVEVKSDSIILRVFTGLGEAMVLYRWSFALAAVCGGIHSLLVLRTRPEWHVIPLLAVVCLIALLLADGFFG